MDILPTVSPVYQIAEIKQVRQIIDNFSQLFGCFQTGKIRDRFKYLNLNEGLD